MIGAFLCHQYVEASSQLYHSLPVGHEAYCELLKMEQNETTLFVILVQSENRCVNKLHLLHRWQKEYRYENWYHAGFFSAMYLDLNILQIGIHLYQSEKTFSMIQ